jgi:arylsulfatase A-like enzyme
MNAKRRWSLAAGLVAVVLAAGAGLLLLTHAPRGRPLSGEAGTPFNVVIVLVDALRADRLPFYGHPKQTAPFLSQLAAKGAVFERSYAASTWTPSSVSSLFTGLYPNQHQVWTGFAMTRRTQATDRPLELNRLPDGARTLAESMKRRGYRTFGVSSNPNFAAEMGFQRGFDRFQHHREGNGAAINRSVLQWKGELERAPKYLLYVHYMDTHKPYPRHEAAYDAAEPNPMLARYDSAIGYVDERIQELYAALRWHERTLLIVTADHGEEFGDHGGAEHDNTMYAELLRVPLLLSWPGMIAPRRVADNVSNVDLLPTIEALTGKANDATPVSGVSLLPLLEGKSMPARTLFAMRRTERLEPQLERTAAIRDDWKYILTIPGNREELFDTRRDPRDKHDLIAQSKDVAVRLRGELEAFDAGAKKHPRAFVRSEQTASDLAQQLRSLGYVQ